MAFFALTTTNFTIFGSDSKSSSSEAYSALNCEAIAFLRRSLPASFHASQVAKNSLPLKPHRTRAPQHRAYVQRTPIASRGAKRPNRPVVGHSARWCGIPESDFGHERSHLSNRTHFVPFYSITIGKLARGHDQRSLSGNINPPNWLNE